MPPNHFSNKDIDIKSSITSTDSSDTRTISIKKYIKDGYPERPEEEKKHKEIEKYLSSIFNLNKNELSETRKSIRLRGLDLEVKPMIRFYEDILKDRRKLNDINRKRNELNNQAKKSGFSKNIIKEGRDLREKELKIRLPLRVKERKLFNRTFSIPNIIKPDVPEGKDESENVEVRKWGSPKKFSFKPQDYQQLGESLDLIDVKRTAKVSGTRFGYLKNEAVRLEFALVQLALEILTKEGFIPVVPPIMIKDPMMRGMGYLEHGGEEQAYHLDKDGLYLVGTAEQSIGPMHANEILEVKDLPLRYLGFSTCLRREAGSYGQDTKGIFRVHQFDKMEMFSFVKPQESDKEHEYLLSLEEKLVKNLEIPYQITKMCTGDLGHPAARKYDLNCWFPAEKRYRETHSVSTCTDFQARRLSIKYREKSKTDFVHTLNGTAIAIGRAILVILENYQQKDGSVLVPKVLQKYTGFKKISPKK